MLIVGGNAATLHFSYDALRKRYVYEVTSGAIGPHFLDDHPPRKNGLGRQAITENRALVVPDLDANQPTNYLETANHPAWKLGIRTMAAFPLIVGDTSGVLSLALTIYGA